MSDFERVRAVREAYLNDAIERYFHPRPQIDSNDRRRVFEAGFNSAYDQQQGELTDLHARCEKVEKDAERYRWLRDKSLGQWEHPIVVSQSRNEVGMTYIGPMALGELDTAIDAAIAKERTA